MKVVDIILLVISLCVFSVGAYILWLNYPTLAGETKEYRPFSADISPESFGSGNIQFYPNLRFEDGEISYFIYPSCDEKKADNVKGAFDILEQNTLLRFTEKASSPQISILCSAVATEKGSEGHFVAGEGGPTEIINASQFAVILSSKVSLYRAEKCDKPQIALHEILHALGFDHNNNSRSIMYPVTDCEEVLDDYIVDEINRLYSIDSFPDLLVEEASAVMNGRYLSFNATISNYGLREAQNASLEIYVGGERVKLFSLGELPVGTKKYLSVENLRVSRDGGEITFVIVSGEKELSDANNVAKL